MSGEDAAKPLKKISLEEFQKVNDEFQKDKSKPLWMVIRGKVIDVTDYQEDHPGQSAAAKISFFTALPLLQVQTLFCKRSLVHHSLVRSVLQT